MNVFVTGIAGFLGSHIAEYCIMKGHNVVGCDNMRGGDLQNIRDVENITGKKIDFYKISCNSIEEMTRITKDIDVVFHCAASPHEGLSVFSPYIINENTYMSTIGALTSSIRNNVKRFVFFSSMARYGSINPPYHEENICSPQDPYGICKLAAEDQVKLLCDVHEVEWSICVPHNIIGLRQKYKDPYRNVVAIMINLMLSGRQPIIYGNGTQKRSFSPIEDMKHIIYEIGFSEKANKQIFNIGPDRDEIQILDLAKRINSIMIKEGIIDFKLDPVFYEDRPQEVKNAYCSSDKIVSFFGYKRTVQLDECLREMILEIKSKGRAPFDYNLDIEIVNDKTPDTWKNRRF